MESNKLPAFQFYPGDWRKDPGVQSLDYHDRGVWFEMLCLMHESEDRGRLVLNGQRMPEEALARLLGLEKQNLTKTITTLVTYGVASVEPETGTIFCRRMVRDEYVRLVRKESGRLGGRPSEKQNESKLKPNTEAKEKQTVTPSSSSSASAAQAAAALDELSDSHIREPSKLLLWFHQSREALGFNPEDIRHVFAAAVQIGANPLAKNMAALLATTIVSRRWSHAKPKHYREADAWLNKNG